MSTSAEFSFSFENYGDRVNFVLELDYPSSTSESGKQGIIKDMNEFMDDLGKPDEASKVYAELCAADEYCMRAVVEYKINGKFSPNELADSIIETMYSMMAKFSVRMETIVENNP